MKLVCCICGMEINKNNMNTNEAAFLGKNIEGYIEFCPFCGAKNKYLLEENFDGIKIEIGKLDEDVLKILDHAVKLELFNSDFYKKASRLAESTRLKVMFEHLARIEYVHARIHSKLCKLDEMPILKDISYDRYTEDKMLLEQARLREKHAIEYYDKYTKSIENDAVREIIEVLREVEKEHIVLLCN